MAMTSPLGGRVRVEDGIERYRLADTKYPIRGFQGGSDNLIHIVVAVLSEAADKKDIGFACSELFITLVKVFVFWAWYGIVRITFGLRVFPNDRSAGVLLTREVLEFSDAGVSVVVGIVNYGDGLMLRCIG